MPWMLTRAAPPCRGGHTSSNTALEGYQRPLEEVAHAIQRALALHVPTTFFLIIERLEYP